MKENLHFIPAKGSTRKLCNLHYGKSNKRKPCGNMYGPESIGSNLYFSGLSYTLQGTVQGKLGKLITGENAEEPDICVTPLLWPDFKKAR